MPVNDNTSYGAMKRSKLIFLLFLIANIFFVNTIYSQNNLILDSFYTCYFGKRFEQFKNIQIIKDTVFFTTTKSFGFKSIRKVPKFQYQKKAVYIELIDFNIAKTKEDTLIYNIFIETSKQSKRKNIMFYPGTYNFIVKYFNNRFYNYLLGGIHPIYLGEIFNDDTLSGASK